MLQARWVFEAAESADSKAIRKLLAGGARTDYTDEVRCRHILILSSTRVGQHSFAAFSR